MNPLMRRFQVKDRRAQAAAAALAAGLVLSYAGAEWLFSKPPAPSPKRVVFAAEAPVAGVRAQRPASSLTRPLGRLDGLRNTFKPYVASAGYRTRTSGLPAPRPSGGWLGLGEPAEDRRSGPSLGNRRPRVPGGGLASALGSLRGAARRLAGAIPFGGGSAGTSASLAVDRPSERGGRAQGGAPAGPGRAASPRPKSAVAVGSREAATSPAQLACSEEGPVFELRPGAGRCVRRRTLGSEGGVVDSLARRLGIGSLDDLFALFR